MIGKLIIENNRTTLKTNSDVSFVSISIPKDKQNKVNDIFDGFGFVWVEFTVDDDVLNVKSVYDEHFGTSKESVYNATDRYDNNEYPVGGFIPGFSTQRCVDCKTFYSGDKKSTQCELCAYNL
jgi:hypothetical protein